jgi:glycosyltransferase involved in cell wall biosynthesis
MKIGLVNLIARSSDVLSDSTSVIRSTIRHSRTDADLNIVKMGTRIAARGHEVKIFVADAYRPMESVSGRGSLSVEYLPTRLRQVFPPSVAPLNPSLVSRLRQERFDVVQSGELFQPGTVLSWFGTEGIRTRRFIWQELDVVMRPPIGYLQQGFYRTAGKAISRDCSRIIPRSISARNHLLKHGISEEKLGPVIHSGVDTKAFRPLEKKILREEFGVEYAENVVLAVSRLDPIKGLDTLIRAMTVVSLEIPDSLLIIQGNGPAYPELSSLVKSLDIEEHVKFIIDSIPHGDMPQLYNVADVLAITSRVDLFPFVAIEAISCGVPLATSFARGLKTDIVDKGGGIMLPEDPNSMGESLASLLRDRQRLNQISNEGRSLAIGEFDFEICADRFLAAYEEAGT